MAIVALFAAALLPHGHALAAQASPGVSSYAWYWKEQRSETIQDPSGADAITIEAPSPFCPGAGSLGAPEQTCRAGRLPVEVRGGDYDEPSMMSAVAFDLVEIPIGSTVQRFTVTFVEADDDQSRPINADGKTLQACIVEDFFGDGDAREYDEAPAHTCNDNDPKAEREEVEKNGETTYEWTFNLTRFARTWVEAGAPVTGIMLYPVEPDEPNGPDNVKWRVVMAGPSEENAIRANIRYTPGEDPLGDFDPIEDPLGDGGFSDDFGSTNGGFGSADAGFSDGDAGDLGDMNAGAEVEGEEPVELDTTASTAPSAAEELAPGLPWYVWLALLGGIVGFNLVRGVVLEQAAGIRPDGVLAQIQRLNAERRGRAIAAQTAGEARWAMAPLIGSLKRFGARFDKAGAGVRNALHKINPRKKG